MNKIYREILKNLALFAIIMAIMPGVVVAGNINPAPTPPNIPNNGPIYNVNKNITKDLNKESIQMTVTANPLWTNTGIYVNTGDTIYITASGIWNIGFGSIGPDGFFYPCCQYDRFLVSALQGELIAFVGIDPYQGNWGNGLFFPQSTGYWAIGSNGQFVSNKNGILWLGMNDDAVSRSTFDNTGSVSAYITIRSASSITVLSPNGGENWPRDTIKTISWSSVGNPGDYVKIELLKGGYIDSVLTYSTYNDGSFNWVILPTQTLGNDYKVRITSISNPAYIDTSDNNFAISSPPSSITVLYPNGGENWPRGNTKLITWTYNGNPGPNVRIELLKGGVSNRIISWGTPNDGSFSWTVPVGQILGNDYKVRITSTSNSAYTDTSNNNFAVISGSAPSIRVISPNGGESWARGSSKLITWTYTGSPGTNVRIQLYRGSSLVRTISSSTPNDGSFSWSIPWTQAIGTDYRIKITSTSNSAYNDWSNNNFRIY